MKTLNWTLGIRLVLVGGLLSALLLAGCAGKQRTVDLHTAPVAQASDTPANATSYGHPFRLVAFVLHPVGVALDYLIVRPVYYVASLAPGLFGYTPEDEAAFRTEQRTY
ncbi:MAG: hypothetical protein HY282_10020 [Nitrospirae bacterium]|nr:hypothetical protein [Candidatus Manganitrophaceae bacterium]